MVKATKNIQNFIYRFFFSEESDKRIAPEMDPLTLRFIGRFKHLEGEYIDTFKKNLKRQSQIAHIIGIIFYAGFSILDEALVPQYADDFIFIRLAIVIPLILISLCLTTTKIFFKYMSQFLSGIMFFVGLGVVAMIAIGGPEVNSMYYPGLILAFVFAYIFVGM